MKKRINLFNKKKHFASFAAYSKKIVKIGTVMGIILFTVFLFVIIQGIILQQEKIRLTAEKEKYLSSLLEDKDIEANIRYFKGKQTQLLHFEKDDAHFVPYYTILRNVLSFATESAELDRMDIDKTRNTTFAVVFKSYEGMISFLKYVESDEFLSHFEELSMANLNLTRDLAELQRSRTAKKIYQLEFKGKFKEIKNDS